MSTVIKLVKINFTYFFFKKSIPEERASTHKAEGQVPDKWAAAVKKGLWLWQELRGPTK